MNRERSVKIALVLFMAIVACALPYSAARAADQAPEGITQGGMRFGVARVNTEGLTAEQLQAYESAKAIYEQTEDTVLQELIAAGVLTAEDVQAYQAMRAQRGEQPPQGQQPPSSPEDGVQPAPMQGGAGGIWGTLAENTTSDAVQAAMQALQQAENKYRQALSDAGIEILERSGQPLQSGM